MTIDTKKLRELAARLDSDRVTVLRVDAEQAGETILSLLDQLEAAQKDAKRLDYVLAQCAFVVATVKDGGMVVYQLQTQDEDENYIVLSGIAAFFPTTRAAIDAAMESGK